MTRVFIADDHAVVRHGIKQVLESHGFEVVGEAEHGAQVLRAPDIDRWDVLVLDLSLPRVNGEEVLRRVRARRPDLPVVVLSMYPEEHHAGRLRAAGASVYLSKARPAADLVAAVRAAVRGERSPAAAAAEPEGKGGAPRAAHERLTHREHQIFMLVVKGHKVADIAAELDVHSCTVSNHLAKIRLKLGVASVAEMVRYACAVGLCDSGPAPAEARGGGA